MEAQKYVWKGAIPLQIHLHESEITTLPPPPPALVLAPRIGYLPLLASLIKPHFSSTLPPGVDTIWFEYKGLPLKWHIPTGVLFDLLCAEPERPWNITVHFRGYPGNLLIPCEGEESIKWSFINSLKEASYIIHGNCKNIMNMSQPDQVELWRSVLNAGNLEAYLLVSSKLKLETAGYENMSKTNTRSLKSLQSGTDAMVQATASRIPIRLYVRSINDINNLEDAPSISSWDKVSYINRPLEIHGEEGKTFTLLDAVRSLLPEFFPEKSSLDKQLSRVEGGEKEMVCNSEDERADSGKELQCSPSSDIFTGINLVVRIQGIEPKMQIPFLWVVNNLMNPEHFLHISVFREVPQS